jgi:hypothetical protein
MQNHGRHTIALAAVVGLPITVVLGFLGPAALADSSSPSPTVDSTQTVTPLAAACAASANIWAADASNIYEFGPTGTLVNTIALTPPSPAGFEDLTFAADGALWGSTTSGFAIYRIDPVLGTSTSRPTSPGQAAHGLGATTDGNLVSVNSTGQVVSINQNAGGAFATTTVLPGTLPSNLTMTSPGSDIVPLASGQLLLVATDTTLNQTAVVRYSPTDGSFIEIGTLPGITGSGAAASDGRLIVTGTAGQMVSVDSLPTTASTASLPTTLLATSPTGSFLGATSQQEAVCPIDDVGLPIIGSAAVAAVTSSLVMAAVCGLLFFRRRRDALAA